ncbi:MAG: formyltetrahydrofolate deformylase [Cytophagales bacterium]|uniref:formyltetrahydrofolate deformylase n=1 Tax=Cyclobacterium marinum TaxID=104 RepID=UPI0011F04E22|nr:formyltetrahydrofolate deformylase [Cyclobacterium marinum]MBI0401657.1 formyltetrahydrofolate deformylase [Cyclobacterium marinum]MBR9775461.1 formyltetrahydrofolate deformylase [Cytophagales bacterium]|tara:strand:+ start:14257 stop:15111 length:855 start_codon:yes stop_codon:yes gene_type:complete
MHTAILIVQCKDNKGIVAAVSQFLYENNGNILAVDQYIDEELGDFFMRAEWELETFAIEKDSILEEFKKNVGFKYEMQYSLSFNFPKPKMALFVSKLSHCLFDILSRYYSGQFNVEIPLVISNHPDLEPVVKAFGIPYYHLPVTKENKFTQEKRQLELMKEHQVDFVVLARYMQILSGDFIKNFPNNIINIHHSFLPAFVGAKPYHAAYKRGVKIIGATAHYVTEELDAGPIIEQDVARVRHHNTIDELVQIGQDVEKVVLSKAIKYHLARKIQVVGNRTIIFN